jgi:sugar (pentulose or hexulose) kinase
MIDIGSTSIKYVAYDYFTDKVILKNKLPFPDRLTNDNALFYEVSIEKITRAIDDVLLCVEYLSIGRIVISVQMHGYILADLKGKLLTQYISWQDRRSEVKDKLPYPDVKWHDLGTSYKANLPLCSLYTHKLNENTEFFTLGSYIAWYLTGNNTSHITDCAASGFYNVDSCSRGVDEYPTIKLPQAVSDVKVIGKYKNIDVYSPVGDHQISFLGSNVADYEYLLNISTATQISTLSSELSENYECRPYFDKRRLCTISGLIGGRTIRKLYSEEQNEEFCNELAENYSLALKKLPKKEKLLVSGGAVQHYPELIKSVCDKIGIPYRIQEETTAFNGLEILVKEVVNNENWNNA